MNWTELRALGMLAPRQRAEQGERVVRPWMQAVRRKLERAHRMLREQGYLFLLPDEALSPPQPDKVAQLDDHHGPLPLSLKYFWLEVGAVDFRQSRQQLVQWQHPERGGARPIEILGEEDPLCVVSADGVWQELSRAPRRDGPSPCFLALDEYHKANYSGGENYHFFLPDATADMAVYPLREWMSDHIDLSLQGGGFRGRICDDFVKRLPDNPIALEIGAAIRNV